MIWLRHNLVGADTPGWHLRRRHRRNGDPPRSLIAPSDIAHSIPSRSGTRSGAIATKRLPVVTHLEVPISDTLLNGRYGSVFGDRGAVCRDATSLRG